MSGARYCRSMPSAGHAFCPHSPAWAIDLDARSLRCTRTALATHYTLSAVACGTRSQRDCQQPRRNLTWIMRTVPGIAAVHCADDPVPFHHFYCPFFSLPRAFETTPERIPPSLLLAACRSNSTTLERASAIGRSGLGWSGLVRRGQCCRGSSPSTGAAAWRWLHWPRSVRLLM